ncbi:unnamed protein product [Oppiella nova]|uniref:RNA helicase n=1 Tax=Oppiella nova TaxID=334625 RepID=A0A7R9LJ68_9ACAR|nr:unnamed protein product [Oppiella nova]CAG2164065.1 unnamed protein product [Oppiella nova]
MSTTAADDRSVPLLLTTIYSPIVDSKGSLNGHPSGDGNDKHSTHEDRPTVGDPDGVVESNCDEMVTTFDDMNLKEELLRGIHSYGFETPSAIEQRATIPCINAILQGIDTSLNECQAVILTTKRKVALKIQKLVLGLSQYMTVRCYVCANGSNIRQVNRQLREGLVSMIGLYCVNTLVLDRMDWMLYRGYDDVIHDIAIQFNPQIQVRFDCVIVIIMLAKMFPKVLEVTENLMRVAIRIVIKKEELRKELREKLAQKLQKLSLI